MKRVQIICIEEGRPWLDIAHMSNTNIIPFTTWVGINLDWELNYGLEDFQDRFTRDFVRAESLGLQSGSVSLVLPGITGEVSAEQLAWLQRTKLGMTFVHEIKDWQVTPIEDKVYDIFYDFGYGTPECAVYHYWDDEFPVSIEGGDAEGLLLANDGRAIILVTDFSVNDGEYDYTVTLDAEELGLNPGGVFVDAETGKTLTGVGDYGCTFELQKHDFKVIEYWNPYRESLEGSFSISDFRVFDNKYAILGAASVYTNVLSHSTWDPITNTLDNFHTVSDYDPVPPEDLSVKINSYTGYHENIYNLLIDALLGETDGKGDGRGFEVFLRFPGMSSQDLFRSSAYPNAGHGKYVQLDLSGGLEQPINIAGTTTSYPTDLASDSAGIFSAMFGFWGNGAATPFDLTSIESFKMNILAFEPGTKPVATWYLLKHMTVTRQTAPADPNGLLTTLSLSELVAEKRFGTVYIGMLPQRYGISGSEKEIRAWRPEGLQAAYASEGFINIAFEDSAFDTDDLVRLQLRMPSKQMIELETYDFTKYGDTVYMQFNHPEFTEDSVYGLVFAWDDGEAASQNVAIIAIDKYDVIDVIDAGERADNAD